MNQLANKSLDSVFDPRIPLMTPAKFAEETGMNPETVRTMINRKLLPVVTLNPNGPGKRPKRYINIKKLFELCENDSVKADKHQSGA